MYIRQMVIYHTIYLVLPHFRGPYFSVFPNFVHILFMEYSWKGWNAEGIKRIWGGGGIWRMY